MATHTSALFKNMKKTLSMTAAVLSSFAPDGSAKADGAHHEMFDGIIKHAAHNQGNTTSSPYDILGDAAKNYVLDKGAAALTAVFGKVVGTFLLEHTRAHEDAYKDTSFVRGGKTEFRYADLIDVSKVDIHDIWAGKALHVINRYYETFFMFDWAGVPALMSKAASNFFATNYGKNKNP